MRVTRPPHRGSILCSCAGTAKPQHSHVPHSTKSSNELDSLPFLNDELNWDGAKAAAQCDPGGRALPEQEKEDKTTNEKQHLPGHDLNLLTFHAAHSAMVTRLPPQQSIHSSSTETGGPRCLHISSLCVFSAEQPVHRARTFHDPRTPPGL